MSEAKGGSYDDLFGKPPGDIRDAVKSSADVVNYVHSVKGITLLSRTYLSTKILADLLKNVSPKLVCTSDDSELTRSCWV